MPMPLAVVALALTQVDAQTINSSPYSTPAADHPSAINPASLPLTENLGFEAAKEKAKQTKRLLLVFWCGDTPDDPDWTFCRSSRSMSLRAYIKWHCIAIQTKVLPPALGDAVCRALQGQSQETPAVIIMRDGAIEQVVGTDVPFMEHGISVGGSKFRCTNVCNDRGCQCKQFIPGPLRTLLQSDFAMDRIKARDPVWAGLHDQTNPAPLPPPEPEPLSNTRDDLAPVVWDPTPEEHIGVLDRLAEARRLMKSGDYYQATGLYTWLWERGAELDPSFRPAKLSALVQDIAALIAKRPGARERFEKVRAVRTDRMPWADYGQMHDWFALNGATGDSGETVEFLDYFINDLDESASLPPADAMAYNLLARREDFARAWQLPPKEAPPAARLATIVKRLNPKFPSSVLPEAAEEYRTFAKQFLIDEGSRLYVSLLVAGDEIGAQDVARQIIAARNDAPARLALITTALAADPPQPRLIQLTWLDEAEAMGAPKRPDLRTRLVLWTNPAPKP